MNSIGNSWLGVVKFYINLYTKIHSNLQTNYISRKIQTLLKLN